MPDIDTADLRHGAKNIHSIGPDRAAGLLTASADAIDALRRDFAKARQLASRYGIELGPHFAAHGEHAIRIVGEERGCQPGTCLAEPRCRNRAEMRAAHGTPAEFATFIARAAPELLGSEAVRAIVTYNSAWADATEPSAEVQRALNSELAAMGCNQASATRAEFKRALWSAMKRVELDDAMKHIELDLQTPIGAPSLAIAEQFDAEARAAAEEPGSPGDGVREEEDPRTQAVLDDVARHMAEYNPPGEGVDLWPGSGLPPLLSTTRARIEQWKNRQSTTPGAETYDFTPEKEAEVAEQAERFQGLDDSDRE